MNDREIQDLLGAADVPVSARHVCVYRLVQAMSRPLSTQDIYAATLKLDPDANFVGVARIVRRLWLAGLLERHVREDRPGHRKAFFNKLHVIGDGGDGEVQGPASEP